MSGLAADMETLRPLLGQASATELLRRLPPALALAGGGAYARHRARLIARTLEPNLGVLAPSNEDEIELIYEALRELPDGAEEAQELLAELAHLERAEAARMEAHFVARRPFDPAAARDALQRADMLLARHADPSSDDASR